MSAPRRPERARPAPPPHRPPASIALSCFLPRLQSVSFRSPCESHFVPGAKMILRDDALLPVIGKQPLEHGGRVHTLAESATACLVHRGHYVPFRSERVITIVPQHDVIERGRLQAMPHHDPVPYRSPVRHVLRESERSGLPRLHLEHRSELRPKLAPARVVAIHRVEGLIGALRRDRHPFDSASEQRKISKLCASFIALCGSGKQEGLT